MEQRARSRGPSDREELEALRGRADKAEAQLAEVRAALQDRALELVCEPGAGQG